MVAGEYLALLAQLVRKQPIFGHKIEAEASR
jgi:hypothetical protein